MATRKYDFIVGPETDTLPDQGVIDSIQVYSTSSNYAVLDDDNYGTIRVDASGGNRTITLPTAADNEDRKILIIKTDSSSYYVSVDGEGAETVNGKTDAKIYVQYDSVYVQCNGTGWEILGEIPREYLQDYTTINAVGTASQQFAGHIWEHADGGYNEPNTAWSDIEAYYKFVDSGTLVDDETGTYDLTNNNAATAVDGIMGSGHATELNGSSQYYTQGTLLDTVPTSIAIDFWVKFDDGNPSSNEYLFAKENVNGNDGVWAYIDTNGVIRTYSIQGGTTYYASSSTTLPDSTTDWVYVCYNWDTSNGIRLWINGTLQAVEPDATTLMANGTYADFHIGAQTGPGSYLDGKFSMFRVRDKVLSKADVDVSYATKYGVPSAFPSNDYFLKGYIQDEADTDFDREYKFPELTRNSTYIYRYGYTDGYGLNTTDKLKIIGV